MESQNQQQLDKLSELGGYITQKLTEGGIPVSSVGVTKELFDLYLASREQKVRDEARSQFFEENMRSIQKTAEIVLEARMVSVERDTYRREAELLRLEVARLNSVIVSRTLTPAEQVAVGVASSVGPDLIRGLFGIRGGR